MGDSFSASEDASYTPLPAPGFRPQRVVLAQGSRTTPGRLRYPARLRIDLYRHMIGIIRSRAPDPDIGLCLEEARVFQALGLTGTIGRCNCVL